MFADASTIAFIGWMQMDGKQRNAMYVGIAYENNSVHYYEALAVPLKISHDLSTLDFEKPQVVYTSEGYPTRNIYGFEWGSDYESYFLSTKQILDSNGQTRVISTLVRFKSPRKMKDDWPRDEIEIKCQHGTTDYALAQTAHFVKPGNFMNANIEPINFNYFHKVLYIAFSRNENDLNSAALCIYSIDSINKRLNKKKTITQVPVVTFNKKPTAIVATANGNGSADSVFVGTHDGHILKIGIKSTDFAFMYADITIHKNSEIKSMDFNANSSKLHAITDQYVASVMADDDCSIFTNCSECLNARVTDCGWCALENIGRCVHQTECVDKYGSTVSWQNMVRF